MPTIYIPVYDHGQRQVWEITPRFDCHIDASNRRAVFIDGYHFREDQLFRTHEAASNYWQRVPVSAADLFTTSELTQLWRESK